MQNEWRTNIKLRCEGDVKCRHMTPYKLLRHKFVVFRKFVSEEIRPIIVELKVRVKVLEPKSLLARFFFGWREFDLVLTLLSIYCPQQGENIFASDFCDPNKKAVQIHHGSLRILFSCSHKHPRKLVHRAFCTPVTQFQFWLQNVCSFRHRIEFSAQKKTLTAVIILH